MKSVIILFAILLSASNSFGAEASVFTASTAMRGSGTSGGGDVLVTRFVLTANALLSMPIWPADQKEALQRALTSSKIKSVPVLLDPQIGTPIPNQGTMVAYGSPGMVQLKDASQTKPGEWSFEKLVQDRKPIALYIAHELFRASGLVGPDGRSPDDAFQITIGQLHLETVQIVVQNPSFTTWDGFNLDSAKVETSEVRDGPDGASVLTSSGLLANTTFMKSSQHKVEITGDVLFVQDTSYSPPVKIAFPDLKSVQISLDTTEWESALAAGVENNLGSGPDFVAKGQARLSSSADQTTLPIACYLYFGKFISGNGHERKIYCETSQQVCSVATPCTSGPLSGDLPVFEFHFSNDVPASPDLNLIKLSCVGKNITDKLTIAISKDSATILANGSQGSADAFGLLDRQNSTSDRMIYGFDSMGCGRGATLSLDGRLVSGTASSGEGSFSVLSNYGCDGGADEQLTCTKI